MATKKKLFAVAAVLAGLGAVAAVSAQGNRGWAQQGGQHHGEGQGLGMGPGLGMGDGQGFRRGMFGAREITREDYDTRTRERFARLDKNSDGTIDVSEIEAAMAEGRGGRMQPRGGNPGDRLIQRFDANRDGKVTREEFLESVKKRFAEVDLNNDGKITDDDLPPMMRGRNVLSHFANQGGMPGGRGGRGGSQMGFLSGVEVKDGAITLDAVLAASTKEFDRFDRNKDGMVDKVDMDALRKEMTDYQVKRFIHAYGADKDGKVSREQFATKANERFAAMDANKDGKLAGEELGGGRGGMGGPGLRERMRGWMGRGGPDGHGGHGGRGSPGDMPPQKQP